MEFKIGTIVDVEGRDDLRAYGKITDIKDGAATVHFRQRRTEKRRGMCDSCNWPGFLSVSGNTGEIVCMRSGCGHGHGFYESDEIIPIAKLVNISAKQAAEKRKGMLERLNRFLGDERRERRTITENEVEQVIRIFREESAG